MKAREVNHRIERLGGYMLRQRGSHRRYEATDDEATCQTTVPQHTGDIPNGTLRSIEKDVDRERHGTRLRRRVVAVTETYHVVVTREGDAWLADVPGLAGTHTWARNLPRLDHDVREAIAVAEDLPDGAEPGLDLDYEYRTGDPELDEMSAQLRRDRAWARAAERRLADRVAAAAHELTARGMSVRDAAVLLDVSPQRISQVAPRSATRVAVASGKKKPPRRPTRESQRADA